MKIQFDETDQKSFERWAENDLSHRSPEYRAKFIELFKAKASRTLEVSLECSVLGEWEYYLDYPEKLDESLKDMK